MKPGIYSSRLLFTLLCSIFFATAFSQYNTNYDFRKDDGAVLSEVGFSAGAMNCLTDIGGNRGVGKKLLKDLNLGYTKPSFSLYYSGLRKYKIGFRVEITAGSVAAADKVLQNVEASTFGRYQRNLSFKSNILEFQTAAEVYPLQFLKNAKELPQSNITPYVLAGIGYFAFKPQASLNNTWYDLSALHTEGQGFAEYPARRAYQLKQMNFISGAGIRVEASPRLVCRLEFVYRVLFTDYLDDVSTNYIDRALFYKYFPVATASIAAQLADRKAELGNAPAMEGDQRGQPKNNDAYFTTQIKIGFLLGRKIIQTSCPYKF